MKRKSNLNIISREWDSLQILAKTLWGRIDGWKARKRTLFMGMIPVGTMLKGGIG